MVQRYAMVDEVITPVFFLLSNIMYDRDDHRELIGRRCSDEIVHIIRVHGEGSSSMFVAALRALGTTKRREEKEEQHHCALCAMYCVLCAVCYGVLHTKYSRLTLLLLPLCR
jgi:hypothetical protein